MLEKFREDFRRAMSEGDPRKAYRLAKNHLDKNPNRPLFIGMAATAAEGFNEGLAESHYKRAYELKPGDIEIGRKFARFLQRVGKTSEARSIVRDYAALNEGQFVPSHFELDLLPEYARRAKELTADPTRSKRPVSEWDIRRALYTASIPEGLDRLAQMDVWSMNRGLTGVHSLVTGVLKATASVIEEFTPEMRKRIEREIDEKIIARPNDCFLTFPDDSDTTYVLFSGLAGEISGIPLEKFHWHMRSLRTNVIYVRDKAKNMHLAGTKGVSEDMEGTMRYLADTLESLGTKKLITVGFSGGTFAAMWYGTEMGARACKAYGPVGSVDHDHLLNQPSTKDGPPEAHLQNIAAKLPQDMNLRGLIESHPEASIDLYYGDECERDLYNAAPLLGLDNVRHNHIQGAEEHQITVRLIASGKFIDTLTENVEP